MGDREGKSGSSCPERDVNEFTASATAAAVSPRAHCHRENECESM